VQDDFGAALEDGVDLDLRRRHRHHDHRPAADLLRRQRHALRMVCRRGADDAALEALRRELDDLVVGAAQALNENTGCMSSRLNSTRLPSRAERLAACSSGVSMATSLDLRVENFLQIVRMSVHA